MSDDLAAFKRELRQAGQPWSRWGVRLAGAGVVGLLLAQIAPLRWSVLPAVISLILLIVGWVLLIVAVYNRWRWAKAHPIHTPSLVEPTLPGPDAP